MDEARLTRVHADAMIIGVAERMLLGPAHALLLDLEDRMGVEMRLGVDGRLSELRKRRLARVAVMKRGKVRNWRDLRDRPVGGSIEAAFRFMVEHDEREYATPPHARRDMNPPPASPPLVRQPEPVADDMPAPIRERLAPMSLEDRIRAGVPRDELDAELAKLSPQDLDRLERATGRVLRNRGPEARPQHSVIDGLSW